MVFLKWDFVVWLAASVASDTRVGPPQTNYTPNIINRSIHRDQGPYFFNRPLYGNHNGLIVLTGDIPIVQYGATPYILGQFLLGVQDVAGDGPITWLHGPAKDFHNMSVRYSSDYSVGKMVWTIKIGNSTVIWTTIPSADGIGMASKIDINLNISTVPPFRLVWAFGGMHRIPGGRPLGWTYDGAVNLENLQHSFDPKTTQDNIPTVFSSNNTFSLTLAGSQELTFGAVSAATSLSVVNTSDIFPGYTLSTSKYTANSFMNGLQGWFKADAIDTTDGTKVASWKNMAPGASPASSLQQENEIAQPILRTNIIGSHPAVVFDGVNDVLNTSFGLPATKTLVTVVKTSGVADSCCSAIVDTWGGPPTNQTNGIALQRVGDNIKAVVDYNGENDGGGFSLQNSVIILTATFAEASSAMYVNGCLDVQVSAHVASITEQLAFGGRLSDQTHLKGRYLSGAIGEVMLYDHVLNSTEQSLTEEYLIGKWGLKPNPCPSPPVASMILGTLEPSQNVSTIEFAVQSTTFVNSSTKQYQQALNRTKLLSERVVVTSPDDQFSIGVSVATASIDGLYRKSPPVFLHGAMAWDVPLVGWRSQYGGTVWGWSEEVAAEGVYMFGFQENSSASSVCKPDPAHKLTVQAPDSRFYGKGRIHHDDGMYDMQSQFFDQQIHMWRWTGNSTHEALLLPALTLHAEWAKDCFDDDGDGLYHAYINTWPTDSVWFNGGAAPEESGYMYRAHHALRDMAKRRNDTTNEALHQAIMDKIQQILISDLWIQSKGHLASYKEETGGQRLRPDAWAYSVFVPIEADLLSDEEAAQSLYYTEWGLQRDQVPCNNSDENTCGVRVWTSNWVPSIWSVREFWPGDNYALAQAYFKTGLPDGGWEIFKGNMAHDQYNFVSPGVLGASNGGIDFNDIVHPFARSVVEGIFGYQPDFPNSYVVCSPQFPSTWDHASVSTPEFALSFVSNYSQISINFSITQPAIIELKVPIRSAHVVSVLVDGINASSNSTSLGAGFGQSILTFITPSQTTTVSMTVKLEIPIQYTPSVHLPAVVGSRVHLPIPSGRISKFSDPSELFLPSSINSTSTTFSGIPQNGTNGFHIVFIYMDRIGDPSHGMFNAAPQIVMYKINVTDPIQSVLHSLRTIVQVSNKSTWTFTSMGPYINANVSDIYYPDGGYVSPRPETCSARIATDGYSPWTYTYGQGNKAPHPQLDNITANLNSEGNLQTPSGGIFDAKYLKQPSNKGNIAFVSQWDNFPNNITVQVNAKPGDTIWTLIAGSTNPMQTGFANGRIVFNFQDAGPSEALELIPPINYWCLSTIGGLYYNYQRDWYCLPKSPPPQVQLGDDCNAMVYSWKLLSPNRTLQSVTLEALSLEVVIGFLGLSVMS